MKSFFQKGSGVFKAIEEAWKKSGEPQSFSIKVLDAGQKNFLGWSTRPAVVSFTYPSTGSHSSMTQNVTSSSQKGSFDKKENQPSIKHTVSSRSEQRPQGQNREKNQPQQNLKLDSGAQKSAENKPRTLQKQSEPQKGSTQKRDSEQENRTNNQPQINRQENNRPPKEPKNQVDRPKIESVAQAQQTENKKIEIQDLHLRYAEDFVRQYLSIVCPEDQTTIIAEQSGGSKVILKLKTSSAGLKEFFQSKGSKHAICGLLSTVIRRNGLQDGQKGPSITFLLEFAD